MTEPAPEPTTEKPPYLYWADDQFAVYCGDALYEPALAWRNAHVLVFDPPYGRDWKQGQLADKHKKDDRHAGIVGDKDTTVRDEILAAWGPDKPVICFGDLMLPPPRGTKLVGVYHKGPSAGQRGAIADHRRDAEAIYWIGPWPSGIGGRSSVFQTAAVTGPTSPQGKYQHPHAKPLDLMEWLMVDVRAWARLHGVDQVRVADPTAGSGSTLAAARNFGFAATGVEWEEHHCSTIQKRLMQDVLFVDGEV